MKTKIRLAVSALTLSASTLVGIAAHEQFRGNAYMPTKYDVPTIGFGSTEGVKMGDKIDPVRALMRLEDELDTVYVAGVKRCVKVPLYDHEFGALVSFTYNNGVAAFCSSTLVAKLNAGEYAAVCPEMMRWNKQWTGKRDENGRKIMIVLDGLTERRAEECAIFRGEYADKT